MSQRRALGVLRRLLLSGGRSWEATPHATPAPAQCCPSAADARLMTSTADSFVPMVDGALGRAQGADLPASCTLAGVSTPSGWQHQQLRWASSSSSKARRHVDPGYDKHHRLNEAIHSRLLQVQLPDGHTALMTRKDALKRAAELNLDLVEFKVPPATSDAAGAAAVVPLPGAPTPTTISTTSSSSTGGAAAAGTSPAVAKILSYVELKRARLAARAQSHEQARAGGVAQEAPGEQGVGQQGGTPAGRNSASAALGAPSEAAPVAGASSSSSQGGGGARVEQRRGEQRRQRTVGGAGVAGAGPGPEGAREGKGQKGAKEGAGGAGGRKVKVKEVFLSPHIAAHDMQVRMRKVRGWLEDGLSVSISQEVDSTGSTQAAELALDSITKQVADLGSPKPGSRAVRPTLVTVVLVPSAAAAGSAGSKRGAAEAGGGGGGKRRKESTA